MGQVNRGASVAHGLVRREKVLRASVGIGRLDVSPQPLPPPSVDLHRSAHRRLGLDLCVDECGLIEHISLRLVISIRA